MSDKLSRKQEAFCYEYVKDRNGQKAAERAGYSAKHARKTASRLLKLSTITDKIEELGQKLKMDAEEALQLLGEIARDDSNKSVQLRALENVIKVHGLARENVTVDGGLIIEIVEADDWRKKGSD